VGDIKIAQEKEIEEEKKLASKQEQPERKTRE
jgi:hypothetical protein